MLGDPVVAENTPVPSFDWMDASAWTHGGGVFNVRADYRLMIDNLMDLTHETYVHAGSIGQKEIDEQPVRTRREGDQIITERYMNSVQAPPFWQAAMRQQGWIQPYQWIAGRYVVSASRAQLTLTWVSR